jgi:hypothetical protein
MPEQYEHHGQSGEYVMLPSGEVVSAAEYKKPSEPTKPVKPAPKAQD